MFRIDYDHFVNQTPNIIDNELLRNPQIEAYQAVYDHFVIMKQIEHAKVILPTGTGKTGLMGILPYSISEKRVLIITPQLVIKDAVLGSLDPEFDNNFWIMTNVFKSREELPSVIEYETQHDKNLLQYANIVILNVHKLQERLRSSLLKKVEPDFFDMIIIDEAHHSEAKTWQDAIEYFDNAKVVKVTGTPWRSDGKVIQGKDVYEYKLREAMAMGYVKSLEKITHVPDKMYLTIDKDENVVYTIDQIRELGLKDEDWINRSVALSPESNRVIVDESIALLEEKLVVSNFPHKIIAVASSIWHADQLKKLYEEKGYEVAIVHSHQEKPIRHQELQKIEQHQVKVVINVAMLGEGYDHKYLSVAAIFRPYKKLLPYAQFIGRVLRSIDNRNGIEVVPEDNIAAVVYHKELGLEELWSYYKEELIKKAMIEAKLGPDDINPTGVGEPKNKTFGFVYEEGIAHTEVDTFIETSMIEQRKQRLAEDELKVSQMMELLNISREKAQQILKQTEPSADKQRLLRPDLFVERARKRIDRKIKVEIVPDLLVKYNLSNDGTELKSIRNLFPYKYNWIHTKFSKNAEMLAIFLETRLNDAVGGKRDKWSIEDWPKGEEELERIVDYLRESLDLKLER